ncbi:MAG: CDP-diacylglycerol--serine O-phosphatidyltransferase [Planctomycetota bacterium]
MDNTRLGLELTLPTALTLGNLLCGFFAVLYAVGHGPLDRSSATCCWMLAAIGFDALDGVAARRLGSESKFGTHLDALADMVSFGVAPSLLCLFEFQAPYLGMPAALVYLSSAALRLARFSTESFSAAKPRVFSGLPSPAAAACVAALVLVEAKGVWPMMIVALVCGLMLSRRPFLHPASLGASRLGVAIGAALVISFFSPALAVGSTVAGYLLLPLLVGSKPR